VNDKPASASRNQDGRDMASSWITRRATKHGQMRYRVMFRVGGRESSPSYAGSFLTMREAKVRRDFVAGELAAMRIPDLRLLAPESAPTLATVAERWRMSRVDVSDGTMQTYLVALGRLKPRLGSTAIDRIDAQTVADLVADLHARGLRKATISKTLSGPPPDRCGRTPCRAARSAGREVRPADGRPAGRRFAIESEEFARRLPPKPWNTRRSGPRSFSAPRSRAPAPLQVFRTWGDVDEPRRRWRVSRRSRHTIFATGASACCIWLVNLGRGSASSSATTTS
jgi:hypothetical protein